MPRALRVAACGRPPYVGLPVDHERRWLLRLSKAQERHPWRFVLSVVLLVSLALPSLLRLGLRSDWIALLPEGEPSVRDFERVRDRVQGLETLTVMIEGGDLESMQRFARDLVPKLEAIPGGLVQSVDWNVSGYARFVEEHRHLYADLALLEEARDALSARERYERLRANPLYVDLEDLPPPDSGAVLERLRTRDARAEESERRYPAGFFVSPSRRFLAVYVRTDIGGGQIDRVDALTAEVERAVASLRPRTYAPGLRTELAGSVLIAREEHVAVARELAIATTATVVLVLASLLFFFGRIRSVFLLGAGVAAPVLVTFGLATPMVGFLNASTAFLGGIVVGNGINPHIIWLARYFEERRRGEDVSTALRRTHLNVIFATLPASFAAAIAYGSLLVTDFRGFRDFGAIGFTGMVLCWAASVLFLPALTVISERYAPLAFRSRRQRKNLIGAAASALVLRSPGGVLLVSLALTVATFSAAIWAVAQDPWEYDFQKLKSERKGSTRAQELHAELKAVVDPATEGTFIAAVVERTDDAAWLDRRLTALAARGAPWGNVRSAFDLLPQDQQEKLRLLDELRAKLTRLRPHLSADERAELDEALPPPELAALTLSDLPPESVRPFSEPGGRRGTLVLVEQQPGRSTWDGRYLIEWTGALRKVRLPDGTRPPLAGRAPVFADMLGAVLDDAIVAIALSFGGTVLLVVFAFRSMREHLYTLLSLLVGIVWMAGTMALAGMKLNFLNFVAFPITFGNGVDYGVNVTRRYVNESVEGSASPVRAAVRESGGAVMLCSLTTIIGYLSLFASANQALRSFGSAMAISEVTCLLAALLTLPALLEARHAWRVRVRESVRSSEAS